MSSSESGERDVIFEALSEEEGALLDVEGRKLYTLNATGKIIFEAAREGLDVAQIVERLVATFDVRDDCAREDVERLLRELRVAGLVPQSPAKRT